MSRTTLNRLGQEVGLPVEGSAPAMYPAARSIVGNWCRLEPLSVVTHLDSLWKENSRDEQGAMWTYMFAGPFGDRDAYHKWLDSLSNGEGTVAYAVVDSAKRRALGSLTFMRIGVKDGTIEIGNVAFSPALQRTRLATEAIFLLAQEAFDHLGFRRLEWKCDATNSPSRRAALRFGFAYEGTFFNAVRVKGRNRDTAWYAMTVQEWPLLREGFLKWLASDNFAQTGEQVTPLGSQFSPLADGPHPNEIAELRARQR